jgi:hypothetical protein
LIADEAVVLVSVGSLDVGVGVAECDSVQLVFCPVALLCSDGASVVIVTYIPFFADQFNLSCDLAVGIAVIDWKRARYVTIYIREGFILHLREYLSGKQELN